MSRPWTRLVLVLALSVSARSASLASNADDECEPTLRDPTPILKRLSGAGLDGHLRASPHRQLALPPTAFGCSTRASLTPAATAFAFDHDADPQHRSRPGRAPPHSRPT